MVTYTNGRRVVTRPEPDPWLDGSSRWQRVEPLPTGAPEQDEHDADASDGKE